MKKAKNVSAVIQAKAGHRLVFGLLNPDNDAMFQLEYGFIPPNGQTIQDAIWQPVKEDNQRVNLDSRNYPLHYDVRASGVYRLRNMAGDDTNAVPILIEQYVIRTYDVVEKSL